VVVQVVRVDLERRQIDLGIDEVLEAVRADERRRGSGRSQARPKKDKRKGTPEERRKIAQAARRRKQRPGRAERAGAKGRK